MTAPAPPMTVKSTCMFVRSPNFESRSGPMISRARKVAQLHWGGGTPTYQSVTQMRALQAKVMGHFEIEPDAELAIETLHRNVERAADAEVVEDGNLISSRAPPDIPAFVKAALKKLG